jgi:positive regulator of sigma E activity
MIEERAVVERVHAETMDVRISQPEQCDTCAVRENCYSHGNVLTVPRTPGIGAADQVRVVITNTSVLGLSALVYGVPLIAVLLGIILGYSLLFAGFGDTARTLASLGLGLGLMAVAALVVRHVSRHIAENIEYATERIGESRGTGESGEPEESL